MGFWRQLLGLEDFEDPEVGLFYAKEVPIQDEEPKLKKETAAMRPRKKTTVKPKKKAPKRKKKQQTR